METSRRTWPWVAVIGGLTLALIVTLVLLFTRDNTSDAPGAIAPTADAEPAEYESACGLSGGPTEEPTTTPNDTRFERVEGWPIAVSESSGPGQRDGNGAWTCFARTPLGAVLAAQSINVRLGLAEDFEAVVRNQIVPGAGQDALLADGPPPIEGGITETKGFKVETYSDTEAVVSFWLAQDGLNATCPIEVQWVENDWRVRADATGGTSPRCEERIPDDYVALAVP